jgi:hypothetical protein
MSYDFPKSTFYRTFMTAVFVGLFATIITMVYDLVFVQYFAFPFSSIINVSSLIFGVNLIFIVVGILYYFFVSSLQRGDLYFIILFVLLTIFFVWRAEQANRTGDYVTNHQFRNLLAGIIIIMGGMAAFLVPFLYHNKKFEDHVL